LKKGREKRETGREIDEICDKLLANPNIEKYTFKVNNRRTPMAAKANFGVIVFPGSNCDADCMWAVKELGQKVDYIWHDTKTTALNKYDVIVFRAVSLTAII
jgi:hypothetical protein